MVTSRSARFRELSSSLDSECRRLGYPLRPGAAEEILASRVRDVAGALSIQEASALKSYFDDDWALNMASTLAKTVEEDKAASQGPPVPMPTIVAAQLVSALGVAAKFAAVNQEHADLDECVHVGAAAGDALTVLGAALRNGVEHPQHAAGMPVVSVERRAALLAGEALRRFSERLSDRTWRDCWCGEDDLDHVNITQLLKQVDADLALIDSLVESA